MPDTITADSNFPAIFGRVPFMGNGIYKNHFLFTGHDNIILIIELRSLSFGSEKKNSITGKMFGNLHEQSLQAIPTNLISIDIY